MTRGRKAQSAAEAALPLALRRGSVKEIPMASGLPYCLMIYVTGLIIFVAVKRMHARVDGPAGAAREARVLIRELRDLPGNDVAVLELWILSSHATWQHFRILPDLPYGEIQISP